jgi:hypothetical protein
MNKLAVCSTTNLPTTFGPCGYEGIELLRTPRVLYSHQYESSPLLLNSCPLVSPNVHPLPESSELVYGLLFAIRKMLSGTNIADFFARVPRC